jgi:hypothetical protein
MTRAERSILARIAAGLRFTPDWPPGWAPQPYEPPRAALASQLENLAKGVRKMNAKAKQAREGIHKP